MKTVAGNTDSLFLFLFIYDIHRERNGTQLQREGNLAICNDVDRTKGIMLSEVSQSGKRMTVWCHS